MRLAGVKYDCEVLLKLRNSNARSILDGIERGCIRNAGKAWAWGDAHLLKGLLCKHGALSVEFACLHPTPVLGRRDSRVPGACHPQSLVNQWVSLVWNPGAKVKVERGGGRYSVEISSLHEHGHVHIIYLIHRWTHTNSAKCIETCVTFSKYKKYYTEQEISYLSQITFFHFLLNFLQRNLLVFPSVLIRHRPLNPDARQGPWCYLTTL